MKLPFIGGNGRDPSASQEARVTTPTSDTPAPSPSAPTSPDSGTQPSTRSTSARQTREQLREALDRQALRWIALLEDETKDEDGIPLYSLETKERVFKRASDWLKESKRLFPDEARAEGDGVTLMRRMLKDPKVAQEFAKEMAKFNARNGAPAEALAPARDKAAEQTKAAGGSALAALVFEGEGLTDGA